MPEILHSLAGVVEGPQEKTKMAMMCKMNGKCASGSGMCVHEKLMLLMVLVMAPLAGRFVFHWF